MPITHADRGTIAYRYDVDDTGFYRWGDSSLSWAPLREYLVISRPAMTFRRRFEVVVGDDSAFDVTERDSGVCEAAPFSGFPERSK